jgi:hypothetical protein
MPAAWIGLRDGPTYRRECFEAGLSRLGYSIAGGVTKKPRDGDLLLIWNRYAGGNSAALSFEARGLPVVVAENGYIWSGEKLYALSLNHHNGLGHWFSGGPERWDSLGIELRPWRTDGETVVLAQRGIGERGIAQPTSWLGSVRKMGRVRPHPGNKEGKPLEQDLANAGCAVTWGSGAAIKALAIGVPVLYGLKGWIGAQAASPIGQKPKRDDADRLAMFQRLAWAQASIDEIRSGDAFARLLEESE